MGMSLAIALPKGRLLNATAALLGRLGWGIDDYHSRARSYRLKSSRFPELSLKIFQEKDIPIQVSVGNYDLGICGLDWVEELLVRYPSSAVVKVADMGYGDGVLYAAAYPGQATSLGKLAARDTLTRIASEYPNLAEFYARQQRLRRFSVYPLWGAAEAYPPENAEMVILSVKNEEDLESFGLVPLSEVVGYRAFLIANRDSLRTKDMAGVLASITGGLSPITEDNTSPAIATVPDIPVDGGPVKIDRDVVRLALPDGHQQVHVAKILDKAGIRVDDYPSSTGNRRPTNSLEGVFIKVVRPQDMPLQVANGNFDLAVTGRDWLMEHQYQFPSSPVAELLDLKYGKVKIVAVVDQNIVAGDIGGLRQLFVDSGEVCRVASEYVNIADRYARNHRINRSRIIPTWGASEAFLPEDADLLIENTETGGTIARHKLKIIDTLFESTACLIGSTVKDTSELKRRQMDCITEKFIDAMEAM
jgi:ATP phosphoribosyltransferase